MENILEYKGFKGTHKICFDDNCLHGMICLVGDVVTYTAESPIALKREFQSAVDEYLATCKELNIEPQKKLSGKSRDR